MVIEASREDSEALDPEGGWDLDGRVFDRKGRGGAAGATGGFFKRVLIIALSLAVLAMLSGLIWYAYNWAYGAAEPDFLPLIGAEAAPIKIKPENEGGKVVPYQDKLLLNEAVVASEETLKVEHLLPEPEIPTVIEPLVAVESEAVIVEPAAAEPASNQEPQDTAQATGSQRTANEPEAVAAQPAKIDPIADLIASTTGTDESTSAETATVEAAPVEAAPVEAAPVEATPVEATPVEATPAEATPAEATPVKTPPVEAAPVQTAQVPTDGGYVIQLSSVTAKAAADKEWRRMQKRHPTLLGDMTLRTDSATVNGTVFHRVQTGPFPTRATASDLCAQLKAAGQDCLVKKK